MMPQIEKNIPIPPEKGPGRPTKYPLDSMTPGDSFFVACAGEQRQIIAEQVRSAVFAYKKRRGGAFTTRCLPDGIRVWKIA